MSCRPFDANLDHCTQLYYTVARCLSESVQDHTVVENILKRVFNPSKVPPDVPAVFEQGAKGMNFAFLLGLQKLLPNQEAKRVWFHPEAYTKALQAKFADMIPSDRQGFDWSTDAGMVHLCLSGIGAVALRVPVNIPGHTRSERQATENGPWHLQAHFRERVETTLCACSTSTRLSSIVKRSPYPSHVLRSI